MRNIASLFVLLCFFVGCSVKGSVLSIYTGVIETRKRVGKRRMFLLLFVAAIGLAKVDFERNDVF